MPIQAGHTYIARNQGAGITPRQMEVTVVWVDGENVHYRKEGDVTIHQTTLDRFAEIVGGNAS